jgi:hypothetical protein
MCTVVREKAHGQTVLSIFENYIFSVVLKTLLPNTSLISG